MTREELIRGGDIRQIVAAMLLGDVLAGLSNETEVVNTMLRLDHADKLVVYMEPGIQSNSTVATEVSQSASRVIYGWGFWQGANR